MSLGIVQAKTQLLAVVVEGMAALPTPVVAGGAPRFWHTEDRFPYFTIRTGSDTIEFDSEDFDRDTYTLVLRLVIGHLTSGYAGENETNLDTWIPYLKEYINEREGLQSAAYPSTINGLIRARCTSINGFSAFQNSGLPVTQLGTDFSVVTEWDETLTQAYT
jgi:hypothetical protein